MYRPAVRKAYPVLLLPSSNALPRRQSPASDSDQQYPARLCLLLLLTDRRALAV
jgi:hypothetical protein